MTADPGEPASAATAGIETDAAGGPDAARPDGAGLDAAGLDAAATDATAGEPPVHDARLHALTLTPLITTTHLAVLRGQGVVIPDGFLTEAPLPETGLPSAADPEPVYTLTAPVLEALRRDGTPMDAAQQRHQHREFARALVGERRDPDVWLALRHARLAEDWEIVNLLWVRHTLGLLNRSTETTIWAFESLPEDALRRFPFLRFAATIFNPVLTAHDGSDLRATLRALLSSLPGVMRLLTSTKDGVITLHLLTGIMVQQRSAGATKRALLASKALGAELDRQARAGGVGDAGLEGWCLHQMGMTALLCGRLDEARRFSLEAYAAALSGGIDPAHNVVGAAAQLATIYAIEGDTSQALRWVAISDQHVCAPWFEGLMRLPARIAEEMVALDRLEPVGTGLQAQREGGWRGVEMWPFVARVTVRREVLQGRASVALLDLERVRASHPGPRHAVQPLELELVIAGPQAEALIAIGQAGRAKRGLERIAEQLGQRPERVTGLAVPYIRALLHCGELNAAKRAAQTVSTGTGPHPVADRLEAAFVLTEAFAVEGNLDQARKAFTLARTAVDELRLWRLYATLPPELLDELTAQDAAPLPGQVREWTDRHGPVFPSIRRSPGLTKREMVVLGKLAIEPSFARIAADLMVSVNTVKSQVSSIYRKLGAGSRDEALATATQLGLLDEPAID